MVAASYRVTCSLPQDATVHQGEEPGVADVFISYSRKDKELARALSQGLEQQGRDVWVDLEDIPPSAEWLEEIYAGIEAANAVVFVLSPESLTSTVCRQELEHAVAHRKRLVPVVARDVGTAAVPEALASRNWISLRPGDDHAAALDVLGKALDTDLDWVRAHTRLLVRAREWMAEDHDRSYLLRGSDLKDAEQWLSRIGEDKEPLPTPLQTQYLLASREAATRQQRFTLGAVSVGLVIALGLAVFAGLQWQEATVQRDQADTERRRAEDQTVEANVQRGRAEDAANDALRQRNIAVARQLAAQAELARNGSADGLPRSATLAIGSLARASAEGVPMPEGRQPLRAALALLARPVAHVRPEDAAGTAIVGTDHTHLATASAINGRPVLVWADGEGRDGGIPSLVKSQAAPGDPRSPLVAISRRGRFADARQGSGISLWGVGEVASSQALVPAPGGGAVSAFAFSPDGEYLAAGTAQAIQVWNVVSGDAFPAIAHERVGATLSVTFSPDGRYLAASQGEATCVWDWRGERLATRFGMGESRILLFSPGGDYIVAAGGGGSALDVWDWMNQRPAGRLTHRRPITAVTFGPKDPGYLATATDDGEVQVWSSWWQEAPSRIGERMRHQAEVTDVSFSPDGQYLATASGDKTARVWHTATGAEVGRMTHDHEVTAVAFSPNGQHLATADVRGTIWIWEPTGHREATREVRAAVDPGGGPDPDRPYLAVTRSADGRRVATVSGALQRGPRQRTIEVAEAEGGRLLLRETIGLSSDIAASVDIVLSSDGRFLVVAVRDALQQLGAARVWRVDDGRELSRRPHGDGGTRVAFTPVFSPNGTYLGTSSDGRTVQLWDMVDDRVVSLEHSEPVVGLVFRPDSGLLAAASGGAVRLWEPSSGREIARPLQHDAPVKHLAFSASGEILATATGGASHITWLWDASGRPIERLEHDAEVDEVLFSEDGRYLMTLDPDRVARTWLWQVSDLRDEVCRRLTRNPTHEELQSYLGDEPYVKACPSLP